MTDKLAIIKDLGESLEIIVKGVESEHGEIYLNYLDKLNKLTKLFLTNIDREIAHKNKELENIDNSDNEEIIKKYNNDTGDIDSVSEYSEYDTSDFENENEDDNKLLVNKSLVNKSLEDFDNEIKSLYNNILKQQIITFINCYE